jgi:hypothetical protein
MDRRNRRTGGLVCAAHLEEFGWLFVVPEVRSSCGPIKEQPVVQYACPACMLVPHIKSDLFRRTAVLLIAVGALLSRLPHF